MTQGIEVRALQYIRFDSVYASSLRAVAGIIDSAQLARVAYLHGSMAWSRGSCVLSGGELYAVSDVDLYIAAPLPTGDVDRLGAECTRVYRAMLRGSQTPAAKVSVQSAQQFEGSAEAAGMLCSATHLGVPVSRILTRKPWLRPQGVPPYDFAVPYGFQRWICWAGRDDASNIAALYEITKACGRLFRDAAWWPHKRSLMTDLELREELVSYLQRLRRTPWAPMAMIVREWLGCDGAAFRSLSRDQHRIACGTLLAVETDKITKRLRERILSMMATDG